MISKIIKTFSKREIKIIATSIILGLLIGAYFLGGNKSTDSKDQTQITEKVEEKIYTCSMHPQIKQNKPGLCPICAMDLVVLNTSIAESEKVDPNEIQMTKSAIKMAQVETIRVTKSTPKKNVHLLGKIAADERNIAKLTARFGGRIEKLFVNFTGQKVRKGERLAIIYSPNLVTAQKELLEAIKYKDTNPSFYKAARVKLKLWDLTEKQINNIVDNEEPKLFFDILSPITGTITKRKTSVGEYVKEGTEMFEVIDLSKVWVMFDAYESDLPWIKLNDKITFTISSLPGKSYSAKVSYIDPFVNATTRIAKVRIEINNKLGNLKPEMFVNGVLESIIAKTDKLLIPKSSILWTGKRAIVYVKVANRKTPAFINREIVLGPEAGNFYVVAKGLEVGEEIATHGVFKIDASAQLLGKTSMMNPKSKIKDDNAKMTDEEMMLMRSPEKISIKLKSQVISTKFKSQVEQFIKNYLILKDAFITSDSKLVEKEVIKAIKSLKKIDMNLLEGNAHTEWMILYKPLRDNLQGVLKMKNIDKKRSHFRIISSKLTEIIDLFSISLGKTMYLQYCPMASNDKGAFWISTENEVLNPYFGDMMLKCGDIEREIK